MPHFPLQEYLLASVRILRERGAAWVYLVYSAPSAVSHDEVRLLRCNDVMVMKMLFCFQDKFESNTTYYGSDGTDSYKSSSCLQSDESHEAYETQSAHSGERRQGGQGVIQQYTGQYIVHKSVHSV